MPWVFDSSVTLAWCFEDERSDETAALARRLDDDPATVPNIWPLEIANVLSITLRTKKPRLTVALREQFLAYLEIAPVTIDPTTTERAWGAILTLADRYKLSTYDAAYLELAIRLNVELATLDKELRAAAKDAGVRVIP